MSTGMASHKEIGEAIEVATLVGNDNILLFHCISSYPAPLSEANLNMIQILKTEFRIHVGLSHHTSGNRASVEATVMGETSIENQFTVDRSE